MQEVPTITPQVAAIPSANRQSVLEAMRVKLSRLYAERNAAALRMVMPHFMALDWLVRNGRIVDQTKG